MSDPADPISQSSIAKAQGVDENPTNFKPPEGKPEGFFNLEHDKQRFDGTIQDLRTKFPEFYEELEKFVAQNSMSVIKQANDKMLERMKEHNKG